MLPWQAEIKHLAARPHAIICPVFCMASIRSSRGELDVAAHTGEDPLLGNSTTSNHRARRTWLGRVLSCHVGSMGMEPRSTTHGQGSVSFAPSMAGPSASSDGLRPSVLLVGREVGVEIAGDVEDGGQLTQPINPLKREEMWGVPDHRPACDTLFPTLTRWFLHLASLACTLQHAALHFMSQGKGGANSAKTAHRGTQVEPATPLIEPAT